MMPRAGLVFSTIVILGLALPSAAADKPLNFSKMKKGAKIEVDWHGEWRPAEFLSKGQFDLVNVNVLGTAFSNFPVRQQQVRLPGKSDTTSTPRDPDDPFATPEERARVGQMRKWTTAGGKSTVQARLLRVEDDSVVLRRGDDKEVTVPLDKLGDADRKYLADVKSGKVKLAPLEVEDTADTPADSQGESEESTVPLTPTDLDHVTQIQISEDSAWKYTPSPNPGGDSPKSLSMKLHPSPDIFEKPGKILIAGDKAMVSMRHEPPGRPASSRLQVVNTARNQLEKDIAFDSAVGALAVSPDGKLLVARVEGHGAGKQSELRLYRLENGTAKLGARWTPYRTPTSNENAATLIESDVDWAVFADATHLVTVSRNGKLAAWNLPDLRPIYVLQAVQNIEPGLASGNLAVLTSSHMAILRAADGEVLGAIPLEANDGFSAMLAFSTDGNKLAARQSGRIRVWDLKTKQLWRDFALSNRSIYPSVGWADGLLGIDGSAVVDPDRRVVVAKSPRAITIGAIAGGSAWAVNTVGNSGPELVVGPILPKGFKNPLANKTADELLVVKPGIEVAVDVNVGDQHARNVIVSRLEAQGLKVVPQSNIRLIGAVSAGQTKSANYKQIGTLQRQGTAVQVTEQVLTLKWTVGNETIWSDERRYGAPFHIQMQQGESIQQAVDRASKANPQALATIWVPTYVAVAPKDETTKSAAAK